jgi:hypothetical protein
MELNLFLSNDKLNGTRSIPEIQEYQIPEFSGLLDPSGKDHTNASILATDLTAVVCPFPFSCETV